MEKELIRMETQVIAIIGSRKYKKKKIMFKVLDHIFLPMNKKMLYFISGGADGPDTWADEWCKLRGFEFEEYPILDEEHPFDRNKRVASDADWIVGFVNRDQYRSGTWNTIRYFRERKDGMYIVYDQKGWSWDRKWKK